MFKKQLQKTGLVLFLFVCLSSSSAFAEEAANNETNAAVLYEKASSMLTDIPRDFWGKTKDIRENGWVSENEQVKEILRENQAAIDEFKRATKLENCDFTFGKEIKMTAATPMPQHTKQYRLAGLVMLEGRLYERKGRPDLALKNYLTVLRFASHMNQQKKFVISKMVGLIAQKYAYPALEQYIKQERPSSQDYRSLLINLVSLKIKRRGLESAFEVEKEMVQNSARMIGEEAKQKGEYSEAFFQEFYREVDRLANEFYGYAIVAFKKNEPAVYEETIIQFAKDLKKETKAVNLILNSIKTAMGFPKGGKIASLTAKVLVSMGTPSYGKIISKYYFSQTKFDILTTAVAVKLYELEKGKAPGNLQELVPDYLPEVFADPFNDFKPLKYRKTNESWLIYSFGPDKQDNDAAFECEDWDKKGDIVFSSL